MEERGWFCELGLLPEAANTLCLCLILCEGSQDPSVGRKGSAILWGLTGRGDISPRMGWFKPPRLTRGAHPWLWRPQHVFNNFHEGSLLSPAHLPCLANMGVCKVLHFPWPLQRSGLILPPMGTATSGSGTTTSAKASRRSCQ